MSGPRVARGVQRDTAAWRWALLSVVLCVASGHAAADAMRSVVDKLLQQGEVVCEPTWPVFCGNIHVACAGQTTLHAFAFTLQVSGGQARLTAMGPDDEGIAGRYAHARVVDDASNRSVLLMPESAHGYLKLQADGRYSLRHYLGPRGIMSLGRCR